MHSPLCPSLYQINTRVWLTELSHAARAARHPGRHSGRRAGSPRHDGLRLGLVPERVADRSRRAARLPRQPGVAQRIPGDAAGPPRGGHRRFRVSPSPATAFTTCLAATRRLLVFASGSARAAYGCSSISSPTTPAWIIPGWRSTLSTTSRAPSRTSHTRPRTTRGSNEREEIWCWRTGATRTSRAGRTRCSSTTAIRPRRKR